VATADNRYSRFVAWMKILLPLAALALLSTMFLFARGTTPGPEIPFAELQDLASDPRMSNPSFAGIAPDGSVVTVTARSIRPQAGQDQAWVIDSLRAVIADTEGRGLVMTAAEGLLDAQARAITLTGLARLTTSTGFAMETRGLHLAYDTGTIQTDSALEIRAPFGDLVAGGMTYGPGATGKPQVVFIGGVRLLYQPGVAGPTTGSDAEPDFGSDPP